MNARKQTKPLSSSAYRMKLRDSSASEACAVFLMGRGNVAGILGSHGYGQCSQHSSFFRPEPDLSKWDMHS